MSDIQYPETGQKNINLKSTDICGNTRNEVRQVNIIQRLLEGQYINIVEDGDTATISADPSADYYNKHQINELIGDLDTVKFKVVSALPAVGAENVIYLVAKTAPDVGYDQYIWDNDDAVFYPIGDTDIDLSDYYTKLQADDKFQEKLSSGSAISSVSDTTDFSQVSLGDKTVRQATGLSIWNYIKSKFTSSRVVAVFDSTKICNVDTSMSNPVQYITASDLFSYAMNKMGVENVASVTDNTTIADFMPGSSTQIKRVTGLKIWTYIWNKIKSDKWTDTVDANNMGTDVIPSATAVYNIGKRILVNQYSATSGQTVAQVLTSANLNIAGGYACAYVRNTSNITDRPFADGGAVYVEVIARDTTTRIVRWTDWASWRCATIAQQNGTWGSWYEFGINRKITPTANTSIIDSIGTTQVWRSGNLVTINYNAKFTTTTQGNILTNLPKCKTEAWGVVVSGSNSVEVSIVAGETVLKKRSNGTAAWYKGMIVYECE